MGLRIGVSGQRSGSLRFEAYSWASPHGGSHTHLASFSLCHLWIAILTWDISSYRVDCLGPLGKSTWDLAALLESMLLQHDSYIPFTSPPHNDITRYKIGIVRRRFPADDAMGEDAKNDDEANALYERSLESLRASGAKMVDPADIQDVEQLWTQEAEENDDGAELGGVSHPAGGDEGRARPESGPLIVTELYEAMNAYLSRLTDCKVKSIEELVEWNERNPASSVRCLACDHAD